MEIKTNLDRRSFIRTAGLGVTGGLLVPNLLMSSNTKIVNSKKIPINAHLWVYASKFPPNWDATPVLDTVFSDLSYARVNGLELMEGQLRHDNCVKRIQGLIKKI